MTMMYLLYILLWLAPAPQYYLSADLKRGKHILSNDHGIVLSKKDEPYKLSVFDKYAQMDLLGFAFSQKKISKYVINSWKQKGKQQLEIYQVETKLHVDTAVSIRIDVSPDSKERFEKTPININFNYRTYIINDNNKPQLIFTIATKSTHLNYSIGNHSVEPLYESIPVGLETPDEKEILKLINRY